MQEALYTYREITFDLSITAVKVVGSKLVLHEGAYATAAALAPFPHDLIPADDPFVKRQMLTLLACSNVLTNMHELKKCASDW